MLFRSSETLAIELFTPLRLAPGAGEAEREREVTLRPAPREREGRTEGGGEPRGVVWPEASADRAREDLRELATRRVGGGGVPENMLEAS